MSATASPAFLNGSMDTLEPESSAWSGLAPDGWIGGGSDPAIPGTPDINSVGNTLGMANSDVSTIVPPSVSPDGGTWAGFATAMALPDFAEQLSQTVAGFEVGKKYRISWYQANFGVTLYGMPAHFYDAGVAVSVDGQKIGQSVLQQVGPNWEMQSVEFIATATQHTIAFGSASSPSTTGSDGAYVGFDGARILEVAPTSGGVGQGENPAPVPALGVLGLLGLSSAIGLLAVRRRRML